MSKTRHAFVPPKPNEFDMTRLTSPSKRDSLLCDGDTVDAVLGSVFD